jgi:hypothetical protein
MVNKQYVLSLLKAISSVPIEVSDTLLDLLDTMVKTSLKYRKIIIEIGTIKILVELARKKDAST